VHRHGIDGQWGLVRKNMLAPEEEYALQGRGDMANLHPGHEWPQGTA